MQRFFLRLLQICLLLITLFALFAFWQIADRHHGYHLDLNIPGGEDQPLRVGCAAISISPELPQVSDTSLAGTVFPKNKIKLL